MPQRVLALEIGAQEFKAALVDASFRDYKIVGFHRAVVNPDGTPRSDQLKRFLTANGLLGATAVLTALPGDLVSWRTFFLPFRDRRRLDQTVPFELEVQVPFGLDEVVVDYHVLRRTKEGSKVLAALVRHSDLAAHLQLLADAGVDPKIVDVGPLVNLNVLHLLEKDLPPTFVYVGGNEERLTIGVFRERELVGLRTVTPPAPHSEDVENATAANGKPAGEAERFRVLLADVRWTLMALVDEPLAAGTPCIVCGEGVLVEQLRQYGGEPLGLNMRKLDGSGLKPVPQELRANAEGFITPIGLALREVVPNEVMGVNFRRGEYAYHRAGEETRSALRRTLMLACLVIVLVIGHTYVEYQSRAARLAVLDNAVRTAFKATLPDVAPSSDPVTQLQTLIDAEQKRLDMLAGVVPVDGATAIDALRAVSQALPPTSKIEVDELTMDTGQIRLKATSDSFDAVDVITRKVASTNYFGHVEAKNIKIGKDPQTVDFMLLLDLSKSPP
ncbi:MAG TPA: pilus assembly protein PilM, partial [Terriglobales bacterium]|nr:pilus assembly protein PilM [Terriglobales bacterium]